MGGTLTVSDSAGNCQSNQDSGTKQADGSGILILTMQGTTTSSVNLWGQVTKINLLKNKL